MTKVLVVDDEPNIRALLSATLRLIGFDVQAAQDGASALSAEPTPTEPAPTAAPTSA